MTVFLNSGKCVYSTDLKHWNRDELRALVKVLTTFGTTSDIRLETIYDSEPVFTIIRSEAIDFINVTLEEKEILNASLEPEEQTNG